MRLIMSIRKHANLSLMVGYAILLLSSCHAQNYMDLLTGGDVKYWDFGKGSTMLVSFDKKTQRIRYYDDHLKIYNINESDSLSQGKFFKLEGDTIYTSWIVRQDTICVETLDIISISKRKLHLKSWGSLYLYCHHLPKK